VLLQEIFDTAPHTGEAEPTDEQVLTHATEQEVSGTTPAPVPIAAVETKAETKTTHKKPASLVETSSSTSAKNPGDKMRFAPMPPRYPVYGGDLGTSRRYRVADTLLTRPTWNRWDVTVNPNPNPQRQQARVVYSQMLQTTYNRLEAYCATRVPEQFASFCAPLLKSFRDVIQGLRYGDRPDQICMRAYLCPAGTYVRSSPHNIYRHLGNPQAGVAASYNPGGVLPISSGYNSYNPYRPRTLGQAIVQGVSNVAMGAGYNRYNPYGGRIY